MSKIKVKTAAPRPRPRSRPRQAVPALFSRQAHELQLVTLLQDIRGRHVPAVHQGQGPGIDVQWLFQGLAHLADGFAGDGRLQVMDSVADLDHTRPGRARLVHTCLLYTSPSPRD